MSPLLCTGTFAFYPLLIFQTWHRK